MWTHSGSPAILCVYIYTESPLQSTEVILCGPTRFCALFVVFMYRVAPREYRSRYVWTLPVSRAIYLLSHFFILLFGYLCVDIYIYIYTHKYVYIYICIYICMYIRTSVCIYVHMYVLIIYMYAYICI